MLNQKFDTAIKQRLEGFTPSPSPQAWDNIQKEMAIGRSKAWSTSKIVSVVSVVIITFSAVIYSFTTFNTKEETVTQLEKTIVTERPTILKNNPTQKQTKENLRISEPYVSTQEPKLTKKVSSTNIDQAIPQEETPTLTKVFQEQETIKNHIPTTENTEIKEEASETKEAEKIYQAGEYVTFRFDFQNVTGENVKTLEIWEELPQWCDINSIETISSDHLHVVKTKTYKKYNEVVWKIKGNFSGDLNSPLSKGYIEYKVKINEARSASELNKSKPQIK